MKQNAGIIETSALISDQRACSYIQGNMVSFMYPNTPLKCTFISNLTCSRLKLTRMDLILRAENSSFKNSGMMEVMISNIKTLIIFLIHRVGALISDISTCAFKRGIRVYIYIYIYIYAYNA